MPFGTLAVWDTVRIGQTIGIGNEARSDKRLVERGRQGIRIGALLH